MVLGKFILEMTWGFLEIRGEKKYWWDRIYGGVRIFGGVMIVVVMKWRDEELGFIVEIEVGKYW